MKIFSVQDGVVLITEVKNRRRESSVVDAVNDNVKIKIKISSFRSNENIHKKEDGSYYVVSANKASSVTLL